MDYSLLLVVAYNPDYIEQYPEKFNQTDKGIYVEGTYESVKTYREDILALHE